MGFGFFFVPLVSGYLFLRYCNYTRFSIGRESGYRLVFESAAVGLILLVLARLLVYCILHKHVLESRLANWDDFAPLPYSGTLFVAFVLGPLIAVVINLLYDRNSGAERAVRTTGNYLEAVFLDSMKPTQLVELTLASNKVYVGWALEAKVAKPERKFVEIFPLYSGYRDRETQELVLTTNYAKALLMHLDELGDDHQDKFRVVIPVAEIRTARPFSFRYRSWFVEAQEANAE